MRDLLYVNHVLYCTFSFLIPISRWVCFSPLNMLIHSLDQIHRISFLPDKPLNYIFWSKAKLVTEVMAQYYGTRNTDAIACQRNDTSSPRYQLS
jgi:hypothetical protein